MLSHIVPPALFYYALLHPHANTMFCAHCARTFPPGHFASDDALAFAHASRHALPTRSRRLVAPTPHALCCHPNFANPAPAPCSRPHALPHSAPPCRATRLPPMNILSIRPHYLPAVAKFTTFAILCLHTAPLLCYLCFHTRTVPAPLAPKNSHIRTDSTASPNTALQTFLPSCFGPFLGRLNFGLFCSRVPKPPFSICKLACARPLLLHLQPLPHHQHRFHNRLTIPPPHTILPSHSLLSIWSPSPTSLVSHRATCTSSGLPPRYLHRLPPRNLHLWSPTALLGHAYITAPSSIVATILTPHIFSTHSLGLPLHCFSPLPFPLLSSPSRT